MVRKATDTRERVLMTARNLFSTHGFGGTSLHDILMAVGITKGAFYHYFKSKEALGERVLEQAIEDYRHLAKTVQDDVAEPDSLRRWITLIVQQNAEGQWLNCRLLTRLTVECSELNPMMQDQLRTFWRWCQGFYETLLNSRSATTDIANEDVAMAAQSLICCLFGAIWLDRCLGGGDDLPRLAEAQLGRFRNTR